MCPAASSHQQPSLPESRNWWTPICSDAQVAAICRANVASLATRDGKDFAGIGVENHRPPGRRDSSGPFRRTMPKTDVQRHGGLNAGLE